MKHKLYKNPEHIERTIMRPMAEEIVEKLAISRECVDFYVRSVELEPNGMCNIECLFIYSENSYESETITIYYEQEII